MIQFLLTLTIALGIVINIGLFIINTRDIIIDYDTNRVLYTLINMWVMVFVIIIAIWVR